MRRAAVAIAVVGTTAFLPAVASAQPDAQTPTTVETSIVTDTVQRPVTSSVEETVQRPVTTTEELSTDDDDDDSKAGLWGLLGLLGLLGLAGLVGRKRRDDGYTTGTVKGDTTARGSTSGDH